jgi:heptosyltransferase II
MGRKVLIVQTAFTGDAVLASSLIETLRLHLPDTAIHLLVRQGNESLFDSHPFLAKVWIWQKKNNKYRNLWRLLRAIRAERFEAVVNLQRFAASGFLTALSGANERIGFASNPMSLGFSRKVKHELTASGPHEIHRNLALITHWLGEKVRPERPKLYPSKADEDAVKPWTSGRYVTISPASVWHTKQWPAEKWAELIETFPADVRVLLLGGPGDAGLCHRLKERLPHRPIEVLAGRLSYLQSAALMRDAEMNYTNDSAPLHFASAMNAPVAGVFCSTIPGFGFGPLSERSYVIQTKEVLTCRPCGIHGKSTCPAGHFRCASGISVSDFPVLADHRP